MAKKIEEITGVVKWYQPKSGYGFVTAEDGTEYFAHHSEIKKEGFRKLKKNQKVSFIPEVNKDSKAAKSITILE